MSYQVMPPLSPEERASLRSSIAENGVMVPIDVDEDGAILDGHHRSLIAAELGLPCPQRVVSGLSEEEKLAHAMTVNVERRQLTREQRRDLIARSLRSQPEVSDREHARRTGADHKTVASVRADAESTGEIPQSEHRVSGDGRVRPATQPPRPERVDTETGEVGGGFDEFHPATTHNPEPSGAGSTATTPNGVGSASSSCVATAPAPEPRPIQGRDGKTYSRPAPKPDRERERQREALAEYTATPADVEYRQNFRAAYRKALGIVQFDAARVAEVIDSDQWDLLLELPSDIAAFVAKVKAARPRNLRSVK